MPRARQQKRVEGDLREAWDPSACKVHARTKPHAACCMLPHPASISPQQQAPERLTAAGAVTSLAHA
eukprot:1046083-Alexandrium_andersonii.AAC.1